VIHAQEDVKDLYKKLDFVEEGEIFEEASILHVKMRKKISFSKKSTYFNKCHSQQVKKLQ
jgi:hypothetical protein